MVEMLKSKSIVGFILIVMFMAFIGGVENEQKLDYEEINNITIINQ